MLLRLKNIGSLPLHGRLPGEEWTVRSDGEHRPVDGLWRKRLADEERYKVGILKVLGLEDEESALPTPPPAEPAPAADIGPLLDLFDVLDQRIALMEERTARLDVERAVQGVLQQFEDRLHALEKTLTLKVNNDVKALRNALADVAAAAAA